MWFFPRQRKGGGALPLLVDPLPASGPVCLIHGALSMADLQVCTIYFVPPFAERSLKFSLIVSSNREKKLETHGGQTSAWTFSELRVDNWSFSFHRWGVRKCTSSRTALWEAAVRFFFFGTLHPNAKLTDDYWWCHHPCHVTTPNALIRGRYSNLTANPPWSSWWQ